MEASKSGSLRIIEKFGSGTIWHSGQFGTVDNLAPWKFLKTFVCFPAQRPKGAQTQYMYSTDTWSPIQRFPDPAPEGRTDTLQLSYIPQMLAKYIQYKYMYSTDTCSPIERFPNPAPEGRTDNPQLSYIPQMLAEYIQYKYMLYCCITCS